ncbi:MAG: hypothetical protein RBU30_02285 [Polyangia bacterium]|jgi:glycosyltransferase involved in cell wall biosynthesis|nr:hypothetical protein [Polyangia bacterium]
MSGKIAQSDGKLRIYALFGDGGQHAGKISRGPRHEIHFSPIGFDELFPRPHGAEIHVSRNAMDQALAEMEAFDAVFSDSPEAVLLHYVRRRRRCKPIPWLVNELDFFATAGLVRRYVERHYGEDPLPGILSAPEVQWFTILDGQQERYRRLGMRSESLHYLPMTRASIAFFFPDMVALQDCLMAGSIHSAPSSPVPEGAILAIGSHDRDFDCLERALGHSGLTADVICNLALYEPHPSQCLRWHDSQPPDVYLESIRRASVIVIPLKKTNRAAGQLSCALPMRLAKPIVAANVESIAPLVEHGVTGLTYPPGDASALARCLEILGSRADEAARLGAQAAQRERQLSELAHLTVDNILQSMQASGGASQ